MASSQLLLPLDAPPDLAAELRRLGLPAERRVILHNNARVMVSVAKDGALRIHRGYAWAPRAVLEAVIRWSHPRTRKAVREEATRILLGFPAAKHAASKPGRGRVRERAVAGDDERLRRLAELHEALNGLHFGGVLEPVPIFLSAKMRRKLGHYEPRSAGGPAIVLSRRHFKEGWSAVTKTLIHEMVHQWQDQTARAVDHGRTFRDKARELGIEAAAVVGKERAARGRGKPKRSEGSADLFG